MSFQMSYDQRGEFFSGELFTSIAAELTKIDLVSWSAVPNEDTVNGILLNATNGDQIWIELNPSASTRTVPTLTISGSYPYDIHPYYAYDTKMDKIGTSTQRGAAAVANAIFVRLLPNYRQQRAELLQRKASQDAYDTKRQALANRLLGVAGGKSYIGAHSEQLNICYDAQGSTSGSLQVNADSVTFNRLHLNAELADKILQVIADYETNAAALQQARNGR